MPGCWHISQAWSGSRRQVAALAASQATGTDIQTAAVLQRADAASRPEQDSNEPARHPPAPWADAAAICAWGVLGLGHQMHARHLLRAVDSGLGVSRWSWEHPLEPGGCSSHISWIQDVVCCWSYPCDGKNASAGNRTRVTSMATMYSTTRPLMLLAQFWHRVYIIVFVLSVIFQEDLRLEQKSSSGAQKSKPPDAMRNRHLMGFQGDCVIYAAS